MKNKPDHADSTLSETMAARIEIKDLGDAGRQKEITDAVEVLDGVTELKIAKGALHVSYDPLATNEKRIEEAIRSTGSTVKAAVAERGSASRPANTAKRGSKRREQNFLIFSSSLRSE